MARLARLLGSLLALVVILLIAAVKLGIAAVGCVILHAIWAPLGVVAALGWWIYLAMTLLGALAQAIVLLASAWNGEQL